VFCVARSRLSVYVLPLFVPLSLMLARIVRPRFDLSTLRQRLLLGAWIVVMITLKGGISYMTHPRADDRQRAAELAKMAEPSTYQAISFVQDTEHGVKIEEHTPWGMRLYLDKPIYGVAWNASHAIDQACTELRRHHTVLFVLDKEIGVTSFRSALSQCHVQATTSDLGTWRHRGLVRAWLAPQAGKSG
jgi:4-amino-4-deoxy-L-arabinose transferase